MHITASPDLLNRPPPSAIADLADGCIRFVEQTVGVKLDYHPETLPLLDHYLEQARIKTPLKLETLKLIAPMAGAYFGEVIRRRHSSWWQIKDTDPTTWLLQFESVYMAFNPVLFVYKAVCRVDHTDASSEEEDETQDEDTPWTYSAFELKDEDQNRIREKLALLPAVSEQEFYAPSTGLEVIDLAIETIQAGQMAAGKHANAALKPSDYD